MKSEYKFYGKQKLPDLLTIQEEKELYLEMKDGKPKEKLDAKNKFITCNLRLVIKIARSYERLRREHRLNSSGRKIQSRKRGKIFHLRRVLDKAKDNEGIKQSRLHDKDAMLP